MRGFDAGQTRCWPHRSRPPVALVAAVALGCSELAEGSDTLNPSWGCLSTPLTSTSPLRAEALERVTVGLVFGDIIRQLPIAGLGARLCSARDSECAAPIQEGLQTDEFGRLELEVYRGFEGFLEIRQDGLVPTLFFLPPVSENTTLAPVGLVTAAGLGNLAQNFDFDLNLTNGHLVLRIRDCNNQAVEGVTLVTEQPALPFYLVSGRPNAAAATSGPEGLGGLLNVAPGGLFVVARLSGTPWTVGEDSFAIRAGWMTIGEIGPPQRR